VASQPHAAKAAQASSTKLRLVLKLQDADQEPAGIAVLAALYKVKPVPELLSELPQEQQLHVALLADPYQLLAILPERTSAVIHR
jgi:hypothetical protein